MMGLLLVCLVIGLVVLYPPVRQIIFKGVWATIVGGVILFGLIIVIVSIAN